MPDTDARGEGRPRIRLFGTFRLQTATGNVVPVVSRRSRGLLAYLLLAPESTSRRENLAGILWSDRGESQARASLRQCLLDLRAVLDQADLPSVNVERDNLSLPPDVFQSDLSDLLEALSGDQAAPLAAALAAISTGQLLQDVEIGGLFGDWLARTRSTLEQTIAAGVTAHIDRLSAAQAWREVRVLAEAYLQRDPLDEVLIAAAIRADAALGATANAHRRYKEFQAGLARAYGASPGPVAREAMAAIAKPMDKAPLPSQIGVEERDAIPKGFTPAPSTPVLAVLAFDNLSDDRELNYFSDGVSEEIQQTLTHGSDLRVIGRTSSFQFRGVNKDVRRVAGELGATHIIDGSVRRSGDRVRISAQLIECADHTSLWSGRFDGDLRDIFTLQDEIAAAIAAALQTAFSSASSLGEIDPVAYDLYLKAHAALPSEIAGKDPRIEMLERAVALAPRLAPAWASLAVRRAWQNRLQPPAHENAPAARSAVETAARTALELDPRSGYAYVALSYLEPWGRYEAQEALLEQAVTVAPHNMQTLTAMSQFANAVGRNEEALHLAAQAVVLDPLYHQAASHHAAMLAFTGRYDEAQATYDRLRARWPDYLDVLNSTLHFAAFRGDWPRFDRLARDARKQGMDASVREALRVGEMLRQPTPERMQGLLIFIYEQLEKTGTVEFGPLIVAYRLGLADEVFEIVARTPFGNLAGAGGLPPAGDFLPGVIFDPISNRTMMDDPRFMGFCDRIGLCDYWRRTERWPDFAETAPYDLRGRLQRGTSS